MEKKTVATRLDGESRAWLEGEAKRLGVSQSAVLERVVLAARSGVEAPRPARSVRVPSPAETGTAHWRDPSVEELASARERYPDLSEDRLLRLARAEARQVDMGVPQPTLRPSRAGSAREVNGDRVDRPESDFDLATSARYALFQRLRTPDSAKGIKSKDG